MRRGHRLILIAIAVAAATPSRAATPLETCYESAATRIDVGECLEKRLHAAESALEMVAMAVHAKAAEVSQVSERPQIAAAFEDSERAFREYLERHCAWVSAMAAGGSGAGDMARDCRIRLTERHTADLQMHLPVARPNAGAGSTEKPQLAQAAPIIAVGEWRLTLFERDGERMALPAKPVVTLSFDRNGMVAGRAFVNRYFGTATLLASGQLSWSGALGSTRMAGPPELMAREADYLSSLGLVTRWKVERATLTLDSGDGTVLLRYAP